MARERLDDLQVLVLGIETPASGDMVRELVAQGARVTVAGSSQAALARLERDLGLHRAAANLGFVHLLSRSELRLLADNLQARGRRSQVAICCCAGEPCASRLAVSLLRPPLTLHVLPHVPGRLRRAVASLHVPPLSALIERIGGGGLREPAAQGQRALIATHLLAPYRFDEPSAERQTARRPAARTHA
jgi:NAD(P)-dependent dehydrogenase (short-subunit alcohol dehydrogenase family)